MRAINVFLSILISVAMAALLLEGGLRLLGKGPKPTALEFHPELGWAKKPNFRATRHTNEFRARFELNELGLRDDPVGPKAADEFRVLALGDSFTYGFSVDRDQHFVDLLEGYWRSEGRNIRVINAGTEAYDTAQAARWFQVAGRALEPDLVLLFPYENDLYWNSQNHYQSAEGARAKPRFAADGSLEPVAITQPPPANWKSRYALTRWMVPIDKAGLMAHTVSIAGAARPVEREVVPLLEQPPASLWEAIESHTRGALRGLLESTREAGVPLVLAPIPSQARFDPSSKERFRRRLGGLEDNAWSADRPVETFLRLAREEGIPAVDARDALSSAASAGEKLYFTQDFHFTEAGSRVFATFLHDSLDGVVPNLPPLREQGALPPIRAKQGGVPFAAKLYLGLLIALTLLFYTTYPKENRLLVPLKIGLLLGLVFGIFLGVGALRDILPPAIARWLIPGFVFGVLAFVAYKLGRKMTTISELLGAFIRRGHWYLMPLVVVLVTIGSLLVVAASSPFVAPFIYTLF